MSMYGPEQWGMCFPFLFPYGDGVFGLARRTRLTFQHCDVMHLLREELSFQVTPADLKAAAAWAVDGEEATAVVESPAPASSSPCACSQCVQAC